MKYYGAPMEGITGYIYRNAHAKYFKGIDKYFTPFLTPKPKRVWTPREKNDIIPEHNKEIPLVPQILTNRGDDLAYGANHLYEVYGYAEVNLNLGCPSGTVVSKGKGSGFLREPEKLLHFFDDYFSHCDVPLSVKTRLGMYDAEEIEELMEIYNQFPFTEVILHARVREDFYKNPVRLDGFETGYRLCKHEICYNGDIFCVEDIEKIQERYPKISGIMLGRGLIANPQLAEQTMTGEKKDWNRFKSFLEEICCGYEEILSGNKNALFKLKEIWLYMIHQFDVDKRYEKKIKKVKTLEEYRVLVDAIFEEVIG